MMKLKDMRQGTFRGMTALDKQVLKALSRSMASDPRLREAQQVGRTGRGEAG